MRKLGLLLVMALFSVNSYAQQHGAYFGLNMTEIDAEGQSFDSTMGFEVGYKYHHDFGMVMLRTGAGYVQKNSEAEAAGVKTEVKLAYLEVPVTALYMFNDMFGGFAGLNFDIKMADSCESGGVDCNMDAEGLVYNLVLGGSATFHPNHGAELYYELGMSDVAEDAKIGSSFGARYVYMF